MGDMDVQTTALIEHLDHEFDDAVSEEIGRILLEYAAKVNDRRLAGGGSTRKCKREHKLNAKTRAKPRTGKKRSTRKKRRASNPRCKRTRRV